MELVQGRPRRKSMTPVLRMDLTDMRWWNDVESERRLETMRGAMDRMASNKEMLSNLVIDAALV